MVFDPGRPVGVEEAGGPDGETLDKGEEDDAKDGVADSGAQIEEAAGGGSGDEGGFLSLQQR